jgi:protein SCO1/2
MSARRVGARSEEVRRLWDNSRMTSRAPLLVLFAFIALCMGAAGFYLARKLDHSSIELASGTWLPTPRSVGDFILEDQSGARFTQSRLEGAPTLVFFGFTRCPDVCPTTLFKLAQLKRAAGITDLRVLFISVDPARDTPPLLARYLSSFDPSFVGLTGDAQSLARVAQRFGVAFERVELPGGDYTMDHSATLFLLDRRARIVAVFTPPFEVPRLSADLHTAAAAL